MRYIVKIYDSHRRDKGFLHRTSGVTKSRFQSAMFWRIDSAEAEASTESEYFEVLDCHNHFECVSVGARYPV